MTQPGTELMTMPEGFQTGLEAFEESDAVIPRLSIVQKEGLFEDNLSNERFSSVRIIPLGLVKQRILWPAVKGESDDSPMCKSTNNLVGHPLVDAPKDKQFPWAHSGFDRAAHPPQSDGLIDLPCEACKLKEWGSHPTGKNPWCSEQWVVPVLYDGHGDGRFSPAILTLQRSGVKAIRSYLTPFQKSGSPAFVNIATVTLDVATRGDVIYSKPKFQRGEQTTQNEWPSYATQFMQIKEYLERRPVGDDDGEPVPTEAGANNVNTAPQQAQPQVSVVETQYAPPPVVPQAAPVQQQAAPVQQAAPAQDPWTGQPDPNQWATPPVQQQAPPVQQPQVTYQQPPVQQQVQQQVPQQAYIPPPVVPQAAPVQQPVQTQPTAPAPEPAPAAPAPAPSQPSPVPSQPATQPQAAGPVDPDDDLPF